MNYLMVGTPASKPQELEKMKPQLVLLRSFRSGERYRQFPARAQDVVLLTGKESEFSVELTFHQLFRPTTCEFDEPLTVNHGLGVSNSRVAKRKSLEQLRCRKAIPSGIFRILWSTTDLIAMKSAIL